MFQIQAGNPPKYYGQKYLSPEGKYESTPNGAWVGFPEFTRKQTWPKRKNWPTGEKNHSFLSTR